MAIKFLEGMAFDAKSRGFLFTQYLTLRSTRMLHFFAMVICRMEGSE